METGGDSGGLEHGAFLGKGGLIDQDLVKMGLKRNVPEGGGEGGAQLTQNVLAKVTGMFFLNVITLALHCFNIVRIFCAQGKGKD